MTARTGGVRGERRWSVGAHLAVIVVVVVVVIVGVGSALGRQTWRNAQDSARTNASYLARVAAKTVGDSAKLAREQAVSVAANPGVLAVFEDPTGCSFDFTLDLFPGSHLDLVQPDGRIACSSVDVPSGRSHRGADWLEADEAGELVASSAFTDEVTGEAATAFSVPVAGASGSVVGHVAVVLPTSGITQPIADLLGGPRRFQFALVEVASGRLLSASEGLASELQDTGAGNAGDPMGSAGFLSGSEPIEGTGWTMMSGADPSDVLAPTRAVLLRGVALGAAVLAVLLASIAMISRRITRPLRKLTTAVNGAGPHVDGLLSSIEGPSEIVHLASEFRVATAARDAYEGQLSHQALHDPLTGLPNRALLTDRLADLVERTSRNGARIAVLFFDLDRFKLINDSMGHDVGDQVLVQTAARLQDLVPAGGTLARFGGDEFVVAVEITAEADLQPFADSLLAALEVPMDGDDRVVRITASVGVAISAPGQRPVDLVRDADNAMYAAKDHGRARIEHFDERLRDRASTRLMMATEFRVALDRGELHLAYQPKVDLLTGDIVGVEALLRWDHPGLGPVHPTTFVPIAEETGDIIPVGAFVLDQACRQAVEWHQGGFDLNVSINVSGRQFENGDFPDRVAASLEASGLAPDHLYLELTESLLMSDTIGTARMLEQLHALGVRLSIDDFGTGYSSLAYLHRFRVDELKIDRAFVRDLGTSGRQSLVPAMIAMGRALSLQTVAEGVETPEQATRLRELGCDLGQGFLFARPLAASQIAPLLEPVAPAVV